MSDTNQQAPQQNVEYTQTALSQEPGKEVAVNKPEGELSDAQLENVSGGIWRNGVWCR